MPAPPKAKIWINGVYASDESSFQTNVVRNRDLRVMVTKEGYETGIRDVGTHISTTGTLDLIGAWLFILPAFGFLAPGSMSLQQTTVTIQLVPQSAAVLPATSRTNLVETAE